MKPLSYKAAIVHHPFMADARADRLLSISSDITRAHDECLRVTAKIGKFRA